MKFLCFGLLFLFFNKIEGHHGTSFLISSIGIGIGINPNPYIPNVRNCSGNEMLGYCDVIENYPMERIKLLMADFNLNCLGSQSDILPRISDRPRINHQNKVCPVLVRFVKPQAARNAQNEWRFLVNDENGYIQQVRSETCAKGDGSQCALGQCSNGKSVCRQQYLQRRLYSLSPQGNQIVQDDFLFPSSCDCYID